MVLVTECCELCNHGSLDVDDGNSIVLLECHIGCLRIVTDGNVLRFHVLRDSGARPEDADSRGKRAGIERPKIHGAHIVLLQLRDVTFHLDDAHRAFGIDGIGVVGFPFVGDQQPIPIR